VAKFLFYFFALLVASCPRRRFVQGAVNNLLYCKTTLLFYNIPEQEIVLLIFKETIFFMAK